MIETIPRIARLNKTFYDAGDFFTKPLKRFHLFFTLFKGGFVHGRLTPFCQSFRVMSLYLILSHPGTKNKKTHLCLRAVFLLFRAYCLIKRADEFSETFINNRDFGMAFILLLRKKKPKDALSVSVYKLSVFVIPAREARRESFREKAQKDSRQAGMT